MTKKQKTKEHDKTEIECVSCIISHTNALVYCKAVLTEVVMVEEDSI